MLLVLGDERIGVGGESIISRPGGVPFNSQSQVERGRPRPRADGNGNEHTATDVCPRKVPPFGLWTSTFTGFPFFHQHPYDSKQVTRVQADSN